MIGVLEYMYSSHKAKAHVRGQKHNRSAPHTNPGSVSDVPSKCCYTRIAAEDREDDTVMWYAHKRQLR